MQTAFSVEESYRLHRREAQGNAGNIPSIIVAPETMDAYIHIHDFSPINSIARTFKDKSWITVGDIGADAFYLVSLGVKTVQASSLDDAPLRAVAAAGHLNGIKISSMNAEATGLPSDSVDFVLVKGSFHHFPRPMVAFHELWRIARFGVVLLEPSDGPPRPLDFVRKLAKRILRGEPFGSQDFETVGNFVYRLSINEVYKVLCALQGSELAYQWVNVCYFPLLYKYPRSSLFARNLHSLGCAVQDVLCWLHLMTPGGAVCYAAKQPIPDELHAELKRQGFKFRKIPRNPYITPGTP